MREEISDQKIFQHKIQINREDLRILKCSNPDCISTMFTQIFELGVLSALINPTGQEQLVQLPKMICINCGSMPDLKEQKNVKGGNTKKGNINNSTQTH